MVGRIGKHEARPRPETRRAGPLYSARALAPATAATAPGRYPESVRGHRRQRFGFDYTQRVSAPLPDSPTQRVRRRRKDPFGLTALLAMVLASLAIAGMMHRSRRTLLGVGWDSIAIGIVYMVGIYWLYLGGR